MKARWMFFAILILVYVANGSTQNFSSIASEIVDVTSSKIFSNIKRQCDIHSNLITFKIFQKAENLLKKRVETNLQKSYVKMVRSNSVLKINDYGFRDLKSSVNTYITAAKSCLEMKETQYREKDFPNSIFDLKVFSTPEIEEIVNFIHENMKNALRVALDSKCFKQNVRKMRDCFKNNQFFKNHVSILTDSAINVSPRDFPNYVIRTSQPSFLFDIDAILDFRKCIINVLKSCKFSSLGFDMESRFLPLIEQIQSLLH